MPCFLYQDNDQDKPMHNYSLYARGERSRSPKNWSHSTTSYPRESSPVSSYGPHVSQGVSSYSRPSNGSNRHSPVRSVSPRQSHRSTSPLTHLSRVETISDRSRSPGGQYGASRYSPPRPLSTGRPVHVTPGLNDTNTLLKELPSPSKDQGSTYGRGAQAPVETQGDGFTRRHKQMMELMVCQSPGISYVPSSLQDAWERLRDKKNNTRSDANTTGSSLDISRLSSLLKNPAQHYMHSDDLSKSDVESTISEEEARIKMRQISEKLQRFAETKSSKRAADKGMTRGNSGGSGRQQTGEDGKAHGQKSSEGHYKSGDAPVQRTSSTGSSQTQGTGNAGDGRGRGNGDDQDKKPSPTQSVSIVDAKDETDNEDTKAESNNKDGEIDQSSMEVQGEDGQTTKPKKMAWVITDETLQSVPEDSTLDSVSSDFTACSSVESDGKVVTHTSKRHLPADPKLLKLQQKIAKQKVRYEREHYRELKRKEKINKLEELLKEKGRTMRREARMAESQGSRSGRVTSTPASARYVSSTSGSSSLTMSDITTSTLTGTTLSTEGRTTLRESSPERSTQMSSSMPYTTDQSTECVCVQHSPRKSKSRLSKHKEPKSLSPARTKRVHDVPRPKGMKLQEVDWTRNESPGHTHTGYYMEFEPPKSSGKRSKKYSHSPSRRDKENEMHSRKKSKENSNRAAKKSGKQRTRSPTGVKRRDFGATCPTPISVTPPRQHRLGDVLMVSEAVQTGSGDEATRMAATVPSYFKGKSRHPGMFTPEMSNTPRVNHRVEKLTVRAGPCKCNIEIYHILHTVSFTVILAIILHTSSHVSDTLRLYMFRRDGMVYSYGRK